MSLWYALGQPFQHPVGACGNSSSMCSTHLLPLSVQSSSTLPTILCQFTKCNCNFSALVCSSGHLSVGPTRLNHAIQNPEIPLSLCCSHIPLVCSNSPLNSQIPLPCFLCRGSLYCFQPLSPWQFFCGVVSALIVCYPTRAADSHLLLAFLLFQHA